MTNPFSMAALVVVGPRLLVGRLPGEQVVRGHEHGVRDGDNRFLVAAVPHDASVAGGEGALG
jgi:hypothetical protein